MKEVEMVVACGRCGEEIYIQDFVRIRPRKEPLTWLRSRWRCNFKMDLKATLCGDVNWILLARQEQVAGCWQHGNEPSGSINNGWFMDELRNRPPSKQSVHRDRRWWHRPVDIVTGPLCLSVPAISTRVCSAIPRCSRLRRGAHHLLRHVEALYDVSIWIRSVSGASRTAESEMNV